ncbi:MAG TPA: IclR family transcriptional regulator [Thermodesulfobacteriota bacterium]
MAPLTSRMRAPAAPSRRRHDTARSTGPKSLKTVGEAMTLLEQFTVERPRLNIPALQKLMGLPKTNVYRLLSTLESLGYLEKDRASGYYHLSLRLYEIGSRSLVNFNLRDLGRRYLQQLNERTEETVILSVLDKGDVVHIDVLPGRKRLSATSHVGARLPAHATASGLALLAFSSPEVVDGVIGRGLAPVTERTITSPAALRGVLGEVRRAGVSSNYGGRLREVFGVGAPVIGRSGFAEAALAIAVPLPYIGPGDEARLKRAVAEVAGEFSKALGYVPGR